jgi:hypothetical protein
VITQITMFFPLQFLYEVSAGIAWYWAQADRAKARRQLALVLIGIVLLGVLCWEIYKRGWPWLSHLGH